MQIGDNPLTLIPIAMINIIFYFYILEEYYIGYLYLGPFNPVSDGSILVVGAYLALYFAGNDFWTQIVISKFNLTAAEFFAALISVWQFFQVIKW
jgi:hypothetical protein